MGVLGDVAMVDVGGFESCAVTRAGSVYCWGMVIEVVMDEDVPGRRTTTVEEGATSRPQEISGLTDATMVSAANGTGCAVTAGQRLRCWSARRGTDPRRYDHRTSVDVGLDAVTDVDVTTSREACVVAGADRHVACWPSIDALWPGSPEHAPPKVVEGLSDVVEVAGSPAFGNGCARLQSGAVACWSPALRRPGADKGTWRAELVPGLEDATGLSDGLTSTCASTAAGRFVCWTEDDLRPHAVTGLDDVVASTDEGPCAIRRTGAIVCLEPMAVDPETGQPTGSPATDILPTPVEDAVQAAVHPGRGCAVTRDHEVRCWGADPLGARGMGNEVNVVGAPEPPPTNLVVAPA